jgi:hypothetical protein
MTSPSTVVHGQIKSVYRLSGDGPVTEADETRCTTARINIKVEKKEKSRLSHAGPSRLTHSMTCVRRALALSFRSSRRRHDFITHSRALSTDAGARLAADIAGALAPTQPCFGMAAEDVTVLAQPRQFYCKLLVCLYPDTYAFAEN